MAQPWIQAAACLLLCPAAARAQSQAPSRADPQVLMRPVGAGRVIATAIVSHADKGFDDRARVRDIPDYDQVSVYVAAEYGLTRDVTLLATPSFRDVQVDGGNSTSGLGYTDVGARLRLGGDARTEFTAQGLVRIPGRRRRDGAAQVGQTDFEYDLRLQGSRTFTVAGLSGFAIVEGAYRLRSGEPPNELHGDATLGVRVADPVLLLLSSYNTVSDGGGRGVFANRFRYNNLYLGAAFDVSSRVTLQLGGQGTVAGRNALRERGAFAGVWLRF